MKLSINSLLLWCPSSICAFAHHLWVSFCFEGIYLDLFVTESLKCAPLALFTAIDFRWSVNENSVYSVHCCFFDGKNAYTTIVTLWQSFCMCPPQKHFIHFCHWEWNRSWKEANEWGGEHGKNTQNQWNASLICLSHWGVVLCVLLCLHRKILSTLLLVPIESSKHLCFEGGFYCVDNCENDCTSFHSTILFVPFPLWTSPFLPQVSLGLAFGVPNV